MVVIAVEVHSCNRGGGIWLVQISVTSVADTIDTLVATHVWINALSLVAEEVAHDSNKREWVCGGEESEAPLYVH